MKRILLALAGTLVLAVVHPAAAEPPCEFDGVERVVAIGDVHGAFDRFMAILRSADVVDVAGRWTGGKTHLVQLGDVVDRGPDSRKAIDLLQRLDRDAPKAGGRVHALMGNHEAMRLMRDLRYVHPGEYAAFATSDSVEVRRQLAQNAAPDVRDRLLSETPLGQIEMMRAFGSAGAYGEYLRRLNAVERINGVVFAHGGISPATQSLSCSAINARIRREVSADIETTRTSPEGTLAAGEDGPLWYRGLALETDEFAPKLDAILAAQHAAAIVVAHTVRTDGRIGVRFGGRVFVIDTGMQPAYVATGAASALEIKGGVFTAIYTDRREVIGGAPSAAR